MSRGHILSFTFLLCIPAFACGSNPHTPGDSAYAASVKPGTRMPTGELEREILTMLDTMDADTPISIQGKSVVASAAYHAASGRTCRQISIDGNRNELACHMIEGWQYVPSIFVLEPSTK